jgi:hypothetical protein
MWEPQPLTTLRASKACRGENFTFFTYRSITGFYKLEYDLWAYYKNQFLSDEKRLSLIYSIVEFPKEKKTANYANIEI